VIAEVEEDDSDSLLDESQLDESVLKEFELLPEDDSCFFLFLGFFFFLSLVTILSCSHLGTHLLLLIL